MTIQEIVKLNSEALKIPCPKLILSPAGFFQTPTTRAAVTGDLDDLNSLELHLNRRYVSGSVEIWQLFVLISHEMRHVWQILNREQNDPLNGYKTSDNATSVKEYNEQELELDAWAWACYMAQRNFNGAYPTFDFMGEGYTEKVLARAEQIAQEKIRRTDRNEEFDD